MLRKISIIILVCFLNIWISLPSFAKEDTKINIPLVYPHKFNSPMQRKDNIAKTPKISGTIVIGIQKIPTIEEAKNERYLVEYFIDGKLVYQANGNSPKDQPTFDFEFDTTKYKNGTHKITVNFWDKKGPSAIGTKEIIINNQENQ